MFHVFVIYSVYVQIMYVFLSGLKVLLVEIITTSAAAAMVSQGTGSKGCWPVIHLKTASSVTLQVGCSFTWKR